MKRFLFVGDTRDGAYPKTGAIDQNRNRGMSTAAMGIADASATSPPPSQLNAAPTGDLD
jgi:hypothetical protein